ncbi:hypothetical protein SAMN04515648_4580 [Phyllobacterium sp. CL33Tsu]|uniref:hypothetical protein n=1 Tax=Phyllobacterium sp. CL33Tsu TaxID=1798191 RepID=UPI0008E1D9C7|nr:hypothetical protein [Phyllobacterium sp. CL33Tsu]SFJ55474.1 hypothetical protein SAMN04515648_4580 [Phyllobacterium sp. CL33Tsu]
MFRYSTLAALSASYFVLLSSSAYAYLDPGTGSMILQGIIGGALTVSVVVSGYYYRLKGWFTGAKASKKKNQAKGE